MNNTSNFTQTQSYEAQQIGHKEVTCKSHAGHMHGGHVEVTCKNLDQPQSETYI